MRTYVIADLHGRADLLESALSRIMPEPKPMRIIFLGDYIDRGQDSRSVITQLKLLEDTANIDLQDVEIICLKGNHEAMMVETIRNNLDPSWWLNNGGAQTLISYGHGIDDPVNVNIVPREHIDWINSLPIYFEDEHRVYVHGWVNPNFSLQEQDPDMVMWTLFHDGDDFSYRGKHIVHGHHQHEHGPLLLKHRTNLDVLAWHTGRLVVGVFDGPGGPVDILEVTA